jgi:hypothetical protein
MYFFYVDESGTLDPEVVGQRQDGSSITKEHLYVLAAVSLYEHRWHGFEKTLNRKKWELLDVMRRAGTVPASLDLADCEIKSTWIRIQKERRARPFLARLTDNDLQQLADLYYRQLDHHHMQVFAVVIDKRHLHDYMDSTKLHRKAWELLLEQIEQYLAEEHPKHQGILLTDDLSRERNRSLAMKHAFIQSEGTASGRRLGTARREIATGTDGAPCLLVPTLVPNADELSISGIIPDHLATAGAAAKKRENPRFSLENRGLSGISAKSGREDLNLRPLGPEPSALAKLSHAPRNRLAVTILAS